MQLAEEHGGRTPGMILDSLADGVYVTDLERRIVFWNRSAERLTGWRGKDILGKTCYDEVLVHETVGGHRLCGKDTCPLHRAIVTGEATTLHDVIFAQRRDGRRLPVEITVAPLRDRSGVVVGGVESFRGIGPLLADLERARRIQERAIHADLPRDPRVAFAIHEVPQAYISGDYCRVEALDQDSYAVMVADVMGHGVASALYTIQIRSVWEEARSLLRSPAAFVSHLNEQLCTITEHSEYFATAFFALIDVDQGTMTYVGAGHPLPLLIRGQRHLELETGGGALGMFHKLVLREAVTALQPGDAMLAFTDGAIEVRRPEGPQLGRDGLLSLLIETGIDLTPEGLADLEERLLELTAQPAFEDDLALLGMLLNG